MTAFPITEAQITGNWAETLTYGIYLVTCTFCFRTLCFITGPGGEERLRKPSEIRWVMLSVAISLFIVSTFDDVIGLVHNIQAFVLYTGPGGALADFNNIHDWINIARSLGNLINMILGDFILIYRAYIVYARRWPIIVPSLVLYFAAIAMAIKLMHVEITTSNSAITLNADVTKPWISSFYAITAAQNVLTTSLLVWRIWRVEHQNDRFRASSHRSTTFNTASSQPRRLKKVIRVIAESGAAYTTLVVGTFIAIMCDSNALYPISDATLQATGITFNVIIVRSSPRRDEQFTVFDTNERAMAEQGQGAFGGSGRLTYPHFRTRNTATTTQTQTQTQSDTIKTIDLGDAPVAKETDKLDDDTSGWEDRSQAEAYRLNNIRVNVSTISSKD